MERRKFFETLGIALAGATILKPDFSQSEEIKESIPAQIWDDPGVKYLFPTNVKCGLYHKNVLLVDGKSIESYSTERRVESVQQTGGVRFLVAYPREESAIVYGDLIVDIQQLHEIFLEDTPCTLVVTQNEMQIAADVIIMEIGLMNDINDWRKFGLRFISQATITPL